MKTLIIMRHGKALARTLKQTDLDRSLADKGRENASDMGKFIAMREGTPGLILASSAARTMETSRLVAAGVNYPAGQIVSDYDLYLTSAEFILQRLKTLDDQVESCLVVGHNPGLTDLVNLLGVRLDNLPTGSAVCFRFDTASWNETASSNAKFEWVKLARDL